MHGKFSLQEFWRIRPRIKNRQEFGNRRNIDILDNNFGIKVIYGKFSLKELWYKTNTQNILTRRI